MARTLTPERQQLKIRAIELGGLGLTHAHIARMLSMERSVVTRWLHKRVFCPVPPNGPFQKLRGAEDRQTDHS